MKLLILLFLFISPIFAIEVIQITSDYVFDAFFSIFFYLAVVMAPIFGAIALLKH